MSLENVEKKLVLIGVNYWFIDSFQHYIDNGFKLFVIKTKTPNHYLKNYNICEELGAKIVDYTDIESIKSVIDFDKNTIVLSGGDYSGEIKTLQFIRENSELELEILHQLSKYCNQKRTKTQFVRYFNGDTGWGDEKNAIAFEKKIEYVQNLCFDNDLLLEFVEQNIPSVKTKNILIGWMHTPLSKFVVKNDTLPSKKIISLGRHICSDELCEVDFTSYPSLKPNTTSRNFYCMAGGAESIRILQQERKQFYEDNGSYTFGLSYMSDIFSGSYEKFKINKKYYFSNEGQLEFDNPKSTYELYYGFINTPSKDANYMMNGIIPLISHDFTSTYKELLNNKMAILIKTKKDLVDLRNIPDHTILEYKNNIFKNKQIYTFETIANKIIKLI